MSGKAFLTKSQRGIIGGAFLDEKTTLTKSIFLRFDYFRSGRSGILPDLPGPK